MLAQTIQKIITGEDKILEKKQYMTECSYEYDLHQDFGSDIPKVILKTVTKKSNEEPILVSTCDENLLRRIDKIMTYLKSGNHHNRRIEKIKMEKVVKKEPEKKIYDEDDE